MLNIGLVVLGVVIALTGIYRMYPIDVFTLRFLYQNAFVYGYLIAMIAIVLKVKGRGGFNHAMMAVGRCSADFVPTLLAIPFIIGFGVVVGKYFESTIGSWFRSDYGWVLGYVASAGSATSGTFIGVIDTMWRTPELRPKMLYILVTVPLLSIPILFMRKLGITQKGMFPWMMKASILAAVWLMIPFWVWEKLIQMKWLAPPSVTQ